MKLPPPGDPAWDGVREFEERLIAAEPGFWEQADVEAQAINRLRMNADRQKLELFPSAMASPENRLGEIRVSYHRNAQGEGDPEFEEFSHPLRKAAGIQVTLPRSIRLPTKWFSGKQVSLHFDTRSDPWLIHRGGTDLPIGVLIIQDHVAVWEAVIRNIRTPIPRLGLEGFITIVLWQADENS